MTRSAEDALMEEHENYMKEVSESGIPLWMLDYYAGVNAQWQEKYKMNLPPKLNQHESDKQNTQPDDTGDDTHLFI